MEKYQIMKKLLVKEKAATRELSGRVSELESRTMQDKQQL